MHLNLVKYKHRLILQQFLKKIKDKINGEAEWHPMKHTLSKKQQDGIRDGLKQLDGGKGIPHRKVMSSFRKKYNA